MQFLSTFAISEYYFSFKNYPNQLYNVSKDVILLDMHTEYFLTSLTDSNKHERIADKLMITGILHVPVKFGGRNQGHLTDRFVNICSEDLLSLTIFGLKSHEKLHGVFFRSNSLDMGKVMPVGFRKGNVQQLVKSTW